MTLQWEPMHPLVMHLSNKPLNKLNEPGIIPGSFFYMRFNQEVQFTRD